jgi:septal ring factor EnvC (AmiA/AmiB activator)
MITRTNRTPTFVLAGLIIAVLVLTYNYWTSIKQNNELMKQLNNMAVRVTDITNKKATIDKQNEALSSRIKYFEERAEANQQAINKKDDEMNQLNNKLKEALSQSDSFKLKNDEFSSKLVRKKNKKSLYYS